MVSNRWQKQHPLIQHSFLFLLFGETILLLQLDWFVWLKVFLVALVWLIGLKLAVALNNKYAEKMVRVFRFENDIAVSIVQHVLRNRFIHFNRQNKGETTSFNLRERGLTLTVESFPLNLPIDEHIKEVPATKVELHGLDANNKAFAEMLTEAISEMVNIRVYSRQAV